jgi:nucleotide-binding universal stress UspA family protein
MLPIKTILHPTDLSAAAQLAQRLAASLARDYRARLILMHVRTSSPADYGQSGSIHGDLLEPEGSLETLRQKLAALVPDPEQFPVEVVVLDGTAATEIVNLAKDRACDLIVMGTHGRTGLGRLLMGSVAEQVLRHAQCPVLTVKTPPAPDGPR